MSRSLTPKKDERSAATSAIRSSGSSIARSTASASCTSCRSKKDLPPSTVKRNAAASRASSSDCTRVSRRARTRTSPARLGRVSPVSGSRTLSRAARDLAEVGGDRRGLARRAGLRRSRWSVAGKRKRDTEGSSDRPGGGCDRLVGRLVGLRPRAGSARRTRGSRSAGSRGASGSSAPGAARPGRRRRRAAALSARNRRTSARRKR